MSRIGTKRNGRASICWGLECGDEPIDQTLGWSDLDPDLYIFPHVNVCADECRASFLQHCTEGLAAHVYVQWNKTTDLVTRQRIANRLTVMPISEALDRGATARHDWFATSHRDALLSWFMPDRLMSAAGDIEGIPILNDVVQTFGDGDALVFDPLALTRLAFHASFNPVALCPAAFGLGELLTIAAWTGMLSRGRAVVMPRFVASYWLMLLDEAEDHQPRWEPDAFLLHQAATVVGLEAIRKTSHAVSRAGPSKIRRWSTRPSAAVQSSSLEPSAADCRFQAAGSDPLARR